MPTALFILFPGFEEIEAVVPIDLLRRAGVECTVAALEEPLLVTGRTKITVQADTTLDAVQGEQFDLVYLPGGPGVAHLLTDERVLALAKQQVQSGRPIAAICAAPTVLHKAGLLEGRRYTSHFSVAETLKDRIADEKVIEDGPIQTSRGAGTALDFGLHLIARLTSPEKAKEVAESISV